MKSLSPQVRIARLISAVALWLLLMGASVGLTTPPALAVSQQQLDEVTAQWADSAHALNDVNCSSCHQASETKAFVNSPDHESCRSCHENSVDTFLLGKHGIRLLEGEDPLTPAMARLPMHAEALDRQMNCNTCHDVHTVNTMQASIDSCMSCHNDLHTQNYANSKHGQVAMANRELPRPNQELVTCATCHLPRELHGAGSNAVVKVNHNNTYNLKPRDRMVGDVCMNCHGMEYSYNSIFDDELVEANFDRPPTLSHETFDLMRAAEERRVGNASDSASGDE